MLPVGSLEGVDAAVDLLLAHRERGSHPRHRRFRCRRRDQHGAGRAALRALGFASVDFLVPNRFEFGYGLTPEIVGSPRKREPTLIITVDNGISSIAGVAAARARGIDVLITDHHLPGRRAAAGERDRESESAPGMSFRSRALAGVGVAFYVMAALRATMQSAACAAARRAVADFLDLVALGTVADLVPLDANNRVLVAQGLRRIRAGRCAPGIRALLEVGEARAGDRARRRSRHFRSAPRLNAAGRLDDMTIGIQCLLADDPDVARGARRAARPAQPGAARDRSADAAGSARSPSRDMRAEDPVLPRGRVPVRRELASGRRRAWSRAA